MKTRIKNIIESTETPQGKIFAFTVQILIVISLVTFSISTLPNLSKSLQQILQVIEIITVVIFTIEYILRIYVSENKFKFIFSFFGIIDLIAILPFYIVSGFDLRAVRVFRLLRLFRILKLLRYSKAINRFHRAFRIAKEELILFFFVSVILLYLSAVGIYYFENEAQPEQFKSVFHSLWWAVATLTTVGYGDIFPITAGGRVFTFFVLMVGLGVVAVPAGLVASALSKARSEEDC
jgi:voltage-gated potassium channel